MSFQGGRQNQGPPLVKMVELAPQYSNRMTSHNSQQELLDNSSLQNTQSGLNSNFKVVVRVRPPLERELNDETDFMPVTNIS